MILSEKSELKTIYLVFEVALISTGSTPLKILQGITFKVFLMAKDIRKGFLGPNKDLILISSVASLGENEESAYCSPYTYPI